MKRVFNLLVVDESGSMSIIERQALVGINGKRLRVYTIAVFSFVRIFAP